MRRAYQELHSELVKAYWKTEGGAAKSAIQDLSGEIYDFLSEMEAGAFSGRTDSLKRCSLRVGRINAKIERSRKQIEGIVKSVRTASKIADAMDKALAASAKLLL